MTEEEEKSRGRLPPLTVVYIYIIFILIFVFILIFIFVFILYLNRPGYLCPLVSANSRDVRRVKEGEEPDTMLVINNPS